MVPPEELQTFLDGLEPEAEGGDVMGGLDAMQLYDSMVGAKVVFSFGCARGGINLGLALRKKLLLELRWDEAFIYIDAVNLAGKPGSTTLPDGTTRNKHWAEYYYMGTLLAHTIVIVFDPVWLKSDFCKGELAIFLRNARHATDKHAKAKFPGSQFCLVVIYDTTPGAICDKAYPKVVLSPGEDESSASAWWHRRGAAASEELPADLCAVEYAKLGASARSEYYLVRNEAEAHKIYGTEEWARAKFDEWSLNATVEQCETVFIPARLSADPRAAAEVGREIEQDAYERLQETIAERSDSEEALHGGGGFAPSRDKQADRAGYSELYRRCWQREALSQQGDWKHPHAWWWWPLENGSLEKECSAHKTAKDSHPDLCGRYTCIKKSQMREGSAMDSGKAGLLPASADVVLDVVEVVELQPGGPTRCRLATPPGWVSMLSFAGDRVLLGQGQREESSWTDSPKSQAERSVMLPVWQRREKVRESNCQ